MIDEYFFKDEGHLIQVENKSTYEVNCFVHKNIYHDKISDNVNFKEARPYIEIYEQNKQKLISEFKRSKESRRLIISFYNDVLVSDDPNCMMSMQFINRYDEMSAIVYARSSDVEKFEDDLATIKFILKDFCEITKVNMCYISFISGSFHKYI